MTAHNRRGRLARIFRPLPTTTRRTLFPIWDALGAPAGTLPRTPPMSPRPGPQGPSETICGRPQIESEPLFDLP